ncbi:MAG: N-acetylmuramoyl-L-alanine amidase [Rhodospirillaceae bacterium]|nr:N-acetylmuramoyl-L-alanine amidase [Rhodospirillaceae bacterium]
MKRSFWLFLAVLTVSAAFFSHSLQARPTIKGARVGQFADATRFVLDLSENTAFRIYTLADPYRLVLDLPGAGWALGKKSLALHQGLVETVRFGQFQTETARIVVDLNAPAEVNQAFILPPGTSKNYRLVIDLDEVASQSFRPSTLGSVKFAEPVTSLRQPRSPENEPAAKLTMVLPPDKPKPATGRRVNAANHSTARLIVIDPGHGGADPGAVAGTNIYEKNITLAAAKALQLLLDEMGHKAILSRRGDKYLTLAARAQTAQDRDADLFVSLHADKHSNSKVRGAAVYTLSEKASDAETEALAQRENEVDALFDVNFSQEYDEELRKILISLVQRTTMTCSAKFAGELIPELGKSTKLLGRTHRFAGFRVLKAPKVPSVLVEMGYLSNSKDRRLLLSEDGRYALMNRVANAIASYFVVHETC